MSTTSYLLIALRQVCKSAELRDFSHAEMFALEAGEKAAVSQAPKVSFGS
jgi:hypothetical protein